MAKSRRVVLKSVSIEATDSYEAVLRAVVGAFAQDCEVDLEPFLDRICGVILQSEPLSQLDELKEMRFSIIQTKQGIITLKLHGARGAVIAGISMILVGRSRKSVYFTLICKVFYRRGADSGRNVRRLIEDWGGTDPVNYGPNRDDQPCDQTVHPHGPSLETERTLAIAWNVDDVSYVYE